MQTVVSRSLSTSFPVLGWKFRKHGQEFGLSFRFISKPQGPLCNAKHTCKSAVSMQQLKPESRQEYLPVLSSSCKEIHGLDAKSWIWKQTVCTQVLWMHKPLNTSWRPLIWPCNDSDRFFRLTHQRKWGFMFHVNLIWFCFLLLYSDCLICFRIFKPTCSSLWCYNLLHQPIKSSS